MIEIVWSGNSEYSLGKKYALYEEAGVREYWLMHPLEEVVFRYVLGPDGKFVGLAPRGSDNERIESMCFPDVRIDGRELFGA